MPAPELLRCHAGTFAKLLGEGALITEAMIQRHLDDRRRGLCQSLRRRLYASAQQQFIRTEPKRRTQLAVKMPLRNSSRPGQLGSADDFMTMLARVIHGKSDLADIMLTHAILIASRDSHDTDHPAMTIVNGQLGA